MILEMYDVREKLSDLFVNVLPPLVKTAEYMKDEAVAQAILYYCKEIDSLLSKLHRILPREVEVQDVALKAMLGVEEDEIETSLEKLIRDIQNTDGAINNKEESPVESKDPFKRIRTLDNGMQLKLITGGKQEAGPFKDKGV